MLRIECTCYGAYENQGSEPEQQEPDKSPANKFADAALRRTGLRNVHNETPVPMEGAAYEPSLRRAIGIIPNRQSVPGFTGEPAAVRQSQVVSLRGP